MGQAQLRKLSIATLFGALCSLYYGSHIFPYLITRVAPWLWSWILVGFNHILTFYSATSPKALDWTWFTNRPDRGAWIVGGIWVLYYFIASLITSSHPSPVNLTYDYQYNVYKQTAPTQKPALSQAFDGEQKQQIVEGCYQVYRQALQRYQPAPIDQLKIPSTFFYREGNKLEWQLTSAGTLLPTLPEELLTPENIQLLLPLLAHHLAWNQSNDFSNRMKWDSAPNTPKTPGAFLTVCLLALTGNFSWVPPLAKDLIAWNGWLIDQVYRADQFAVWLGQGPALEHVLRVFHSNLKQQNKPDASIPTLISRIGQLEQLNAKERDAMQKLGLESQQSPTLQASIPLQLYPERESKKSTQQKNHSFFWEHPSE